jgi:UDP-4-amino-4,6-dideoxy-N-acetyl-beta-L-altrosamine transaminase
MEFINFCRPCIGKEEIKEVVNTLRSGWITTGPKTQKFEQDFASYVNAKYAVALNSGTAALHLALEAIDLKKGDEVITTPFTFTATAEVVTYFGAKPVFADIKEDTYNIDPEEIEKKITKRTKVIIPVHYAGHPCDMDKIMKLARKYKLKVIVDAAHAIGSEYKKQMVGSIADITCFSFHAVKNLTTAEGGMLITNNKKIADRVRIQALHGINKDAWKRYSKEGSWYYEITEQGFKYNMMDIQASLGIWQLRKIKKFNAIREKIAEDYNKQLGRMDEIKLPTVKENVKTSWHLYPIVIDLRQLKINRNQFIEELKKRDIGTSVHFIPLNLQPYYQQHYNYKPGQFSVAEKIYSGIISLPLYPGLQRKQVKYICKTIKKLVKEHRKR